MRPYADLYQEFDRASNGERDRLMRLYPGDENFGRRHADLAAYDDAWWAERGWIGGPHYWPPEEENCDNCGGRGQVHRQVSLEAALKDLGYAGLPVEIREALNSGE